MKRMMVLLAAMLLVVVLAVSVQASGTQPRVVMIEKFTGVWCVNCPTVTALLEQCKTTYGNKIEIAAFHWGNTGSFDPYKTTETVARETFYDPASGAALPMTAIDGPPVLRDLVIGPYNTRIDARLLAVAPISLHIGADDTTIYASYCNDGTTDFTDATLHCLITEDGLTYNSVTYNHVVRDMIPDQNGTAMTAPAGQCMQKDLAYTLGTWNRQKCRAIIYVQKNSTKEIVQAQAMPLHDFYVTGPNGGERIDAGSVASITWNTIANTDNVTVSYSTNGGTSWSPIVTNVANEGWCNWTVPTISSTNCLVKVSNAAGTLFDVSDFPFSILPPPALTVTSPNGGESWAAGSAHAITWTNSNYTENVTIEYSTDNGINYTPIATSIANTGTYSWTVPSTPSTQCLVRIKGIHEGLPTDVSNAPFTITAGPTYDFDINSDGSVNQADVTLLANMLAGMAATNAKTDVNKDGVFNVTDLTFELDKVAGLSVP